MKNVFAKIQFFTQILNLPKYLRLFTEQPDREKAVLLFSDAADENIELVSPLYRCF